MTKRQRRLIGIVTVLAVLLIALLGYYAYYRSTKKLSFDLTGVVGTASVVPPPQFLYSFSGSGNNRLVDPLGVLVDGNTVYVVDSQSAKIQVFNQRGVFQRSIGGSETVTPLYIAKNPKTGNIYVSDRRTRSIHIFTPAGKYVGDFNPHLPKNQLPKFQTGGVQWVPIAMAFSPNGSLYVTEFLKGHRLLIFDPNGKFKRSVGTAAIVLKPESAPGLFQFPNGVMFGKDNLVYVADSNNRRVQVFDRNGTFKKIIVTQGLPRGIAQLGAMPSDDASSPLRFVVVDTLSHDATIWNSKGEKVLLFGEQGLLDGQFNYPNNVSVGPKNRMFVTDSGNGRVEVWGWPSQVASIPVIGPPSRLIWCLIPLLLLPLLLLLRKKKFYATSDFVKNIVGMGEEELLTSIRRVKWITTEDQRPGIAQALEKREHIDLFEVWEHSEPDVQALMEKYEIDHNTAVIMTVAQRTRLLCTETDDLRTLAYRVELPTMNAAEFIEKYKKEGKTPSGGAPGNDPVTGAYGPEQTSAESPEASADPDASGITAGDSPAGEAPVDNTPNVEA